MPLQGVWCWQALIEAQPTKPEVSLYSERYTACSPRLFTHMYLFTLTLGRLFGQQCPLGPAGTELHRCRSVRLPASLARSSVHVATFPA